jgi:hypothetical protein
MVLEGRRQSLAMSNNPINLALRFLLEMAALAAIGYWGWQQASGVLRYAWAMGLPLAAAAIWGTFRVPGDASASGKAPVAVPGLVRLAIELAVFGFAAWGLVSEGATALGWVLGALALLHYVVSYDRILWLLRA